MAAATTTSEVGHNIKLLRHQSNKLPPKATKPHLQALTRPCSVRASRAANVLHTGVVKASYVVATLRPACRKPGGQIVARRSLNPHNLAPYSNKISLVRSLTRPSACPASFLLGFLQQSVSRFSASVLQSFSLPGSCSFEVNGFLFS